jgi:isoleucyl-tRNA synthetase
VLTHGFVLDEQGRKMSKSLGNVVAPQKVTQQNGAEILRLWVAASDFTEDLRIGPDIIKSSVDSYRRLRNTIRFMLANLEGFDELERLAPDDMPELERFMLARLASLDAEVRGGYTNYDFNRVFTTVFNFATTDLSSFYFDIRKDVLYCDSKMSYRRRAARTVTDALFTYVVTGLRRFSASPWKRPGPRALARTTACICIGSRKRPANGKTTRCCTNGIECARSVAS